MHGGAEDALMADKPGFLGRIATGARSGFRRYPRHLYHSLKRQPVPSAAAGAGGVGVGLPDLSHFGGVGGGLSAVWIGHATVLMRAGGLNILTDPVFSHRIGMRIGKKTFGLGRMTALPLDVSHLPPIDLVLISHAHFDHLDKPSLARLAEIGKDTVVVTASKTRRLIPKGFGDVVELDWRDKSEIGAPGGKGGGGVRLTALRPRHWGARTGVDKHRGYNSYLIEPQGQRVLFAGDTGHTDAFDDLGGVDLAAIGIGAYDPWIHAHASPEQVWSMFSRMGGEFLLPMHHSTFDLGEEAPDEPMERLLRAAEGQHDRIICRKAGEVWGKAG
jgi:L-ascorbate metabolism protein UlaG (beta-lactamase superfamily)